MTQIQIHKLNSDLDIDLNLAATANNQVNTYITVRDYKNSSETVTHIMLDRTDIQDIIQKLQQI